MIICEICGANSCRRVIHNPPVAVAPVALLRRPGAHLAEAECLHRIRQHRPRTEFTLALLIFAALKSSGFSAPLLLRPT